MLHEPADALVATEGTDEPAALFLCIADGPQDTEKVESCHGVLVS